LHCLIVTRHGPQAAHRMARSVAAMAAVAAVAAVAAQPDMPVSGFNNCKASLGD
jgi:hypothetical protein